MPNFTKGKWNAFYGEDFFGIRAAHADDEQGHDYGNGQIIAHVVRWNDGHSWANARLIAAAPEMYELLKVCAKTEEPSNYVPAFLEIKYKARELLARI